MKTAALFSLFAASFLVTAGCLPETADPVTPDADAGPGPGPRPDGGGDPAPGAYELVTTFDITAGVLAPSQIRDALSLLTDFRAEPTATLVIVLDDAGVPLLADLIDVLPGPVEGQLFGFIDEYIDGALADSGADVWIDQVLALSQTSFASFDAASDLSLATDIAAGTTDITHHMRALAFAMPGRDVTVGIPTVDGVTTVGATATLTPQAQPDDTALAMADHTFGLAYGELMFDALQAWLIAERGADLRGALGDAVDCPQLAATVSNKCVLGACVGHADQLEQICDRGLDLIVDEIRAEFAAMRFDVVRLRGGDATLRDTTGDGVSDAITGGVWDAEIDAGLGAREVPATFAGARAL